MLATQIPGMIEPVEQDLLRDLALSLELGPDDVVCEFGSFMGRSACCLAEGLVDSGLSLKGRPIEPLHCYDLFACAPNGLLAGFVRNGANSAGVAHLLDESGGRLGWARVFDHFTSDLPPGLLRRHVTSIENAQPVGGAIAAMMIDAPKWYPELQQLLQRFAPKAHTGCQIVLQDYFYHWSATMVAAVQLLLEDGVIEPLESAATSLLVRTLRPMTPDVLDAMDRRFRASRVEDLLDRAADTFEDFDVERKSLYLPRLRLAAIQHVCAEGRFDEGDARLRDLLARCGGEFVGTLAEDFKELRHHNFSARSLYELDLASPPT